MFSSYLPPTLPLIAVVIFRAYGGRGRVVIWAFFQPSENENVTVFVQSVFSIMESGLLSGQKITTLEYVTNLLHTFLPLNFEAEY